MTRDKPNSKRINLDAMAQNSPRDDAAQLTNLAAQLTALQGWMTTLCQENTTLTHLQHDLDWSNQRSP